MRLGRCGGGAAVGERQERPFQLSFNGRLKVDFQGSRVTSDGGLLLVRELDERLGFGALIQRHLTDARGRNTQLPLADLVRQSVYSRLAGYEDVNDAERLSQDPAFRLIGSEKVLERGAALTSRLQSFETELLTQQENLAGLARISRDLIARFPQPSDSLRSLIRSGLKGGLDSLKANELLDIDRFKAISPAGDVFQQWLNSKIAGLKRQSEGS